jgi:hypothetical protein
MFAYFSNTHDYLADPPRRDIAREFKKSQSFAYGHGHGHGHGIFILATHPEGI